MCGPLPSMTEDQYREFLDKSRTSEEKEDSPTEELIKLWKISVMESKVGGLIHNPEMMSYEDYVKELSRLFVEKI